jgi:hypothetical protein
LDLFAGLGNDDFLIRHFEFSLVLFQPTLVEYCWCAPGVGAFVCGAVYQIQIVQSISSLENGQ